ncbi:MAG: hypothetical protein NUV65_00185 [Candidatus Roizmanbacteria bacterium]|nr:hypothetical protein [Candidatus Roizmanbacteria bacterium]
MFKKVIRFIQDRPFFCLILLLLTIISFTIIKPDLFLAGWDNYSSYLNLSANIPRTFFATWRAHRGLGVPSDSEVTDIFRQLFSLIVQPIIGKQLVDQLYIIVALNLGVLIMYAFAQVLFKQYISKHKPHLAHFEDIFSAMAAFFYLFNVNTLAVFYFPIQPFVTRFFTLPTTFLLFHIFLHTPPKRFLSYLSLGLLFLFCSTSFVIGTVFLTIVMGLGLYMLFQKNIGKNILVFLLFLAINAFWLLPFLNYTVQKSAIIRLAPTFIEANETQLNKPKSYYSFTKQVLLFPSFFETKISNLNHTQSDYLHPLAHTFQQPLTKALLSIFPILAFVGLLFLLRNPRKNFIFLWIPSMYILFLLLSMKQYSPVGFLYAYFDKHIPLFGVLFRFGDTKFHPMVAFAGSILAPFSILWIVAKTKKIIVSVATVVIFVASGVIFYTYFTGNLIGFFMYNKIPSAYTSIVNTINSDALDGRVLHIPYDSNIYWRSYSWGYVGSEFLGFMLNKPLVEKTFEPASMENANVNTRIDELIKNTQSITTPDGLLQRTSDMYTLLVKTGIRYVILDETVSSTVPSRGTIFWGNYPTADSTKLMQSMLQQGYVTVRSTQKVDLRNYINTYPKQFTISQEQEQTIKNAPPQYITLYEVKNPTPSVTFSDTSTSIDPHFTSLLSSPLLRTDSTLMQSRHEKAYLLFPFLRNDLPLTFNEKSVHLSFSSLPKSPRIVSAEADTTHYVEVTAQVVNDAMRFHFFIHPFPTADRYLAGTLDVPLDEIEKAHATENSIYSFASNWHVLPSTFIGPLRLRIGDTILPVPLGVTATEKTIGSVLIYDQKPFVEALVMKDELPIETTNARSTDNPNCFQDAQDGYMSSFTYKNNTLNITGKNGSTCAVAQSTIQTAGESLHAEFALTVNGTNKNNDTYTLPFANLPKPLQMRVCIQKQNVDTCLNTHEVIQVNSEEKKIVFPFNTSVQKDEEITAVLSALSAGSQEYALNIKNVSLRTFAPISHATLTLPTLPQTVPFTSQDFSFAKPLSPNSFYSQTGMDGWYIPSYATCGSSTTYRTVRILNGSYVNYSDNCDTDIFQKVPFSSENFHLFHIAYNLASGQFPRMIVRDKFTTYLSTRASLNQGYPDIAGFKTYTGGKTLPTLSPVSAYTYIYAKPYYQDTKDKEYTISQYSENVAVTALYGIDSIELPRSWENIRISSQKHTSNTYAVPREYQAVRLLPSLVHITIKPNEQSPQANQLLIFNEAYDAQWGVYKNTFDVVFGRSLPIPHATCNGYANCFVLPDRYTDVYLFYWPERLGIIGWLVTLGVLFLATGVRRLFLSLKRDRS